MRSEKLDYATRLGIGRQKSADFLRRVAADLGRPSASIRCESLERTDEAFALYGVRRLEAERRCSERTVVCRDLPNGDSLEETAAELLLGAPTVPALLFLPESTWCGAVRTDLREVLVRLGTMVRSGEDVLVCSPDGDVGLFVEVSDASEDCEGGSYRVLAWGWGA